ncbi:unnamed protein product [Protopolystoma xenopodis]|uniref:Uncharacterized protein n=1 Tax=Protopolystoma xenopodis TaxID=117903 RepID=A0A3S5ABG7_9PLAT|nr:unnamed protein product [Protopolystoma xenopodis]
MKREKTESTVNSLYTQQVIPPKKSKMVTLSLVSYGLEDEEEDTHQGSDLEDKEGSQTSAYSISKSRLLRDGAFVETFFQPSESDGNDSSSPDLSSTLPFYKSSEPPTIMSQSFLQNHANSPVNVSSGHHTFLASETNLPDTESIRDIQNEKSLSQDIPDKVLVPSELVVPIETENRSSMIERLMGEVQMPSEPAGHCGMELQEKVERAVRRMHVDITYDPNYTIQANKAFRNPR